MIEHFDALAPLYNRLIGPSDPARLRALLDLPTAGWVLVALAERLALMGSHFSAPTEICAMVVARGVPARIEREGGFAAWVVDEKTENGAQPIAHRLHLICDTLSTDCYHRIMRYTDGTDRPDLDRAAALSGHRQRWAQHGALATK